MSHSPLLTLDQQWLLARLEAMLPELTRTNPAAPAAFRDLVGHFAEPDSNPGTRSWQIILRLHQEFERAQRFQDEYAELLSNALEIDIPDLQEDLLRRAVNNWITSHPMVPVDRIWVIEQLVSHFGTAWFDRTAIMKILDATYLPQASEESFRQLHRRAKFLLTNAQLTGRQSCVNRRALLFSCVMHRHYGSHYLSSATTKAVTSFLHWLTCILENGDPLIPYTHPDLDALIGEEGPLFDQDHIFPHCALRFHKNNTCKAIFPTHQLAQHVAERLCEPSPESSIGLVIPHDSLSL